MAFNKSFFAFLLAVFLWGVGSSPGLAQANPQQILAAVIQQLQTGTPNPTWYGPQLWQTIAMQTGNTGVYPPLVQLGQVTNVVVNQQVQLPAGPVYSMTVQHANGTSTWQLGISNQTNRIEYANFNIGAAAQPLPGPATPTPLPRTPAPVPGTTPTTTGTPPPPGDPTSQACQKFPNLCG